MKYGKKRHMFYGWRYILIRQIIWNVFSFWMNLLSERADNFSVDYSGFSLGVVFLIYILFRYPDLTNDCPSEIAEKLGYRLIGLQMAFLVVYIIRLPLMVLCAPEVGEWTFAALVAICLILLFFPAIGFRKRNID